MKDEVNLRDYVNVVFRRWVLIVSITVIAVVIGGLVSFLSPNTYETKARVLITQAKSEIVFEPKYKTLSEENIASQRTALIALLKSRTVASRVIEQLGDKLRPEEQDPISLLDRVQVREHGDLIEISARATDPQTPASIVNAWVQSYESYVNTLYRGVLQSPEELEVQADAARKDYEGKQKAWEDFVGKNRIDELNRQIADKKMLLSLRSLREQIEAGSPSATSAAANSLALILLQTQAFTSLPIGLQVSLDTVSNLKVGLDDVDALISTLETRLGGTKGQSIGELREEILQLSGELEQEGARKRGLATSRDIAWEAYKTIAGKVVEAEVVTQVPSTVVRVAESAAVPELPVGPNRIMNIVIALIVGLVAGVLGAFGVEWLRPS